jgi:hypothetical protein
MPQSDDGLQAEHWRKRAEQARARAELMRDPDAKATMLEVSQKYEAMADRETWREIIRHLPDQSHARVKI